VGSVVDLGDSQLMDAPILRFTVLTTSGVRTTGVIGLAADPPWLTAEQRAGRQALRKLMNDLTDLSATLGPDAVKTEQPYQPETIAVVSLVSRPWTDTELAEIADQPKKTWPGPALAGRSADRPSCMTMTGAGAATVLDAAASANVRTPWVSGGRHWRVGFRPLLPDETSCDDLI
jgi:hypothetical protein